MRIAEDLYYRLEGKAHRGEPINSPTFRRVFAEWSRVPVADQVVRTAKYVNGNVRRVELWALQYFADTTIDRITEAKLADYVDWRLSQPKRPAVVTLKNERTAIRQLLRFAKRRGYIADVPEFAIKSGRINARPDIPEVEWHRLTPFLPLYVDRARDRRRLRERFYLALYILILGNTGIRVGEARRLRWSDVSTTRTLTDEVLRLPELHLSAESGAGWPSRNFRETAEDQIEFYSVKLAGQSRLVIPSPIVRRRPHR